MQFKDYYEILGVEPSAGEAEIKTAYRRLARKYHPDVSKEAGAEEKFKAVNEAYEALRDPQKRAAYDQLRARGYRPGDEVQPPPGGFGMAAPGGFDFDEIFAGGGAGGGFSDFFEELFGGAARGGWRPARARAAAARRHARQARGAAGSRSTTAAACASASTASTLDVRMPKGIKPGPGDPARRAGRPRRRPAAGDRIRRASAVRSRRPQHHPRAAGGAVGSRAGRDGQRADAGRPGGTEDPGRFGSRAQAAPARPRLAGHAQRRATRSSNWKCSRRARTTDAQREAYRTLRDAFGDDWRRA